MCLTFGFSWIGTTSSPASMHRAFRLFASPSHVHFDGQKPIVVVVKSARSSNNDECPINPKVLLLIDDDDVTAAAMINFLLLFFASFLFVNFPILSLFSAQFHFTVSWWKWHCMVKNHMRIFYFGFTRFLLLLIWAFFSHELQIEKKI